MPKTYHYRVCYRGADLGQFTRHERIRHATAHVPRSFIFYCKKCGDNFASISATTPHPDTFYDSIGTRCIHCGGTETLQVSWEFPIYDLPYQALIREFIIEVNESGASYGIVPFPRNYQEQTHATKYKMA